MTVRYSLYRFTHVCLCAGLLLTAGKVTGAAGQNRTAQPDASVNNPGFVRTLPVEATNSPFYAALAWTGETVSNVSGGKATGTRGDSLLHLGFAANGDAIGLPAGGRLKISAIRVDSGQPSKNLVGDAQVVSNISASSATRIYQFWYRQDLLAGRWRLRAGLIDLNQYFDVLESASDLINSSFGVSPGISANMPSPIFPQPGYGAMVRWADNASALRLGLFQGDPQRRDTAFDNGRSVIAEWQPLGFHADADALRLKLGLWQCRCETDDPAPADIQTWGAYGSIQIPVDTRSRTTLFAHLATSPGHLSPAPFSAAAGLTTRSPFRDRAGDGMSFGVTREDLRGRRAETALEATYAAALSDVLQFQPDIQYVMHPGGTLPNAWVITIRLHLAMDTPFE